MVEVKWLPWPPGAIFAMAPYLTMFRAPNCTSVTSFILLWKGEKNSDKHSDKTIGLKHNITELAINYSSEQFMMLYMVLL